MDMLVFSFSKKSTVSPLKFNLVEDVNLWGRATHEYCENWATMNSKDSQYTKDMNFYLGQYTFY